MKVVRLYTGDDGQSHFEDLELPMEPSGAVQRTAPQAVSSVIFTRYPPGLVADWHGAPRRQYVITLAGQGEIEVGDGTVRQFRAGDVLLAEDLTGQGHITRVVGEGERLTVMIPLAE